MRPQLARLHAPKMGSASLLRPLRVECTTWSRDSHGLFDYEARHMDVRRFLVTRSVRLFRISADVECVPESSPVPTSAAQSQQLEGGGARGESASSALGATPADSAANGDPVQAPQASARASTDQTPATDYLLSIRCTKDGKYMINPADRSLSSSTTSVTPQKLWSIVREQNDNKYILQENDLIKLGRFKLKVKQLVTQSAKREDGNGVEECIPELRLDDLDPPISNVAPEDTQCRICLLEGNQENDPLIAPCDCKGSIKYVHLECLRHWISGRLNFNDCTQRPVFVKQLHCELCKLAYPSAVKYNDERMPVVSIPHTEPPFMVLETVGGSGQKGSYIISMVSKKDVKLGRGHESDVRIPDVSISRYHATIRFVNGAFQLEDHNSKFGTLVSLRKFFPVGNTVTALQVGRSVVKLSMDVACTCRPEMIVDISDEIQEHEGQYSNSAKGEPKTGVAGAAPPQEDAGVLGEASLGGVVGEVDVAGCAASYDQAMVAEALASYGPERVFRSPNNNAPGSSGGALGTPTSATEAAGSAVLPNGARALTASGQRILESALVAAATGPAARIDAAAAAGGALGTERLGASWYSEHGDAFGQSGGRAEGCGSGGVGGYCSSNVDGSGQYGRVAGEQVAFCVPAEQRVFRGLLRPEGAGGDPFFGTGEEGGGSSNLAGWDSSSSGPPQHLVHMDIAGSPHGSYQETLQALAAAAAHARGLSPDALGAHRQQSRAGGAEEERLAAFPQGMDVEVGPHEAASDTVAL